MKIIDGHAHICEYVSGIGDKGELRPIGNGECIYSNGDIIKIIPSDYGDKEFKTESLLKVLKENNVSKAVLLQGNYLGPQNLYTHEAIEKYPSIFTGAFTLDVFYRKKNEIISNMCDKLGFKIIKMEVSNTSGLMCNHNTVNLNGKEMNELYELARMKKMVFVIDIGRPGNDCYQVDNLLKVVKKYTDVNFVICHLMSFQKNSLEDIKKTLPKFKLSNVYFDIASVPNNVKLDFDEARSYVRLAIDILGSNKLIWGSDAPSTMTKANYSDYIDYIYKSDLFTEEEKKNIFYNNANGVYFNKC